MIRYTTGDILAARADALVNTVNCVGIMGRGIALQFKNAFPDNFDAYAAACAREEVQPGRMFVFETVGLTQPFWIINFPTKRHWRGNSKIGDIAVGLQDLRRVIVDFQIRSIAVPPLGSGLGGLDWNDVRPLVADALSDLDTEVLVYEPSVETRRSTTPARVPHMTPGRAALISLAYRYLGGLLDPTLTLLELHKLMYFMQVAGENLRLQFEKAHYGPYATNLSHVLHAIEGFYVSGYMDGGDDPAKVLELVPGAYDEASKFLADAKDTHARFERVSRLVEGFEAPDGMELLATVHWVATQEGADTMEAAVESVHDWNKRKRRFTDRQIGLAFETLRSSGWLESALV